MKHYPTQPFDQRPASFWKLCVLLLLLSGWGDFRQSTTAVNAGFAAEFNQVTLANHRDHYRSLLDINNLPTPYSSDGDSESYWLIHSTVLNIPVLALIHATDLYYLTYLIGDIKYHLPLTRAPPRQ